MTVERITLIRHGRTAWNAAGRWQGLEAVPLDDVGFSQAHALASYWQQPLTAIYTSDLLRAWQTAVVLGEAVGLAPQPDERLREFNLGIFQGLTYDEVREQHPQEFSKMREDYMGYAVPQGETRRALQNRIYAAFNDIAAAGSGHVAIVSHGAAIKVLLFRLFGETEALKAMHLDNTALTTVDRIGEGWDLVELAVTPHLGPGFAEEDVERRQISEQSRPD
jgi:broad specificity phosphatase PhoE